MSEAHRRSKHPEYIRAQLLKVATGLIVSEGFESLTLERVAKHAGVSKGGLQYHFPSKAALLKGVCDSLKEAFEVAFNEALAQEAEGPKQITRAYIRICFSAMDPLISRAICILTLTLPDFAREQGEWLMSLCDNDAEHAPDMAQMLLLCRLAADGLWVAETSGVLRFDEPTRTALLDRLLTLADSL